MRLSRGCYDKFHRCPGWRGGGLKYATTNHCPSNGYLKITYQERLWRLRFFRCTHCDVLVLPYATRYLDPTYWKYSVQHWWMWRKRS